MDRRLWMDFPRCLCLRAHLCWYHVLGVEWGNIMYGPEQSM